MPTVRPSGAGDEAVGTGEVRNGGTVIKGGSNAAGVMTKNLSLASLADDDGASFGSKVIAQVGTGSEFTERVGISGAVAGNVTEGSTVLGFNANATQWVMKGGNVTTTLGGNSNTSLIGGAAGPDPNRSSVAANRKTQTVGDIDLDILADPASGISSNVTITGGGVSKSYINPVVAGGAATTGVDPIGTRSVPGELVYRFGGADPKQDDYKAKDAEES